MKHSREVRAAGLLKQSIGAGGNRATLCRTDAKVRCGECPAAQRVPAVPGLPNTDRADRDPISGEKASTGLVKGGGRAFAHGDAGTGHIAVVQKILTAVPQANLPCDI